MEQAWCRRPPGPILKNVVDSWSMLYCNAIRFEGVRNVGLMVTLQDACRGTVAHLTEKRSQNSSPGDVFPEVFYLKIN